VPEQQTDFIFTAVGEQLGFVGAVGLLALLGVIAWRVLHAAGGPRGTSSAAWSAPGSSPSWPSACSRTPA
jgi:hypothetical protein